MPTPTRWDKIKEQLHDYAVFLRDRGDMTDGARTMGQKMPRKTPGATGVASYSMLRSSKSEELWYRDKLIDWRKAGRLTKDGTLRVLDTPVEPYTLARIKRALPWLKTWDALAVLVELDGVVEANYMDEHRNIRLTLEEMIEISLERKLTQKLGAIFGRVLEEVRADAPIPADELVKNNVGGRKLKCSKCRQEGHRAPTCKGIERGAEPTPPDLDSVPEVGAPA